MIVSSVCTALVHCLLTWYLKDDIRFHENEWYRSEMWLLMKVPDDTFNICRRSIITNFTSSFRVLVNLVVKLWSHKIVILKELYWIVGMGPKSWSGNWLIPRQSCRKINLTAKVLRTCLKPSLNQVDHNLQKFVCRFFLQNFSFPSVSECQGRIRQYFFIGLYYFLQVCLFPGQWVCDNF